MKKFILFLASVFMLASCNDKVLIDYGYGQPNTEKVVNFGTNFYIPGLTKSIIDGVDSLKKNNFAVYAKINGNLNELGITLNPSKKGFFIYGDTLAWTNSKWALKNKTYLWPNAKDGNEEHDPTINFFAYGPIGVDKNGVELVDSTIVVDVNPIEKDDEIKDLVYAKALNQTYKYDNGKPNEKTGDPAKGYVKFNFQHQLSWVEFKGTFTASEGIDSVTIDSVVVFVSNSTAKYYINTKTHKDTLENATDSVSHKYVLDSLQLDSTKYQVIGSFVALPQIVGDTMTAKVYYTIKTADGEIIKGEPQVKLNYGTLEEAKPTPASATAPWTVAKWQKGYKYIYRINVKPREILFTATVESWNPTGTIPEYLIY